MLISHFASASGGLRPQDPTPGYAARPHWGTSVPRHWGTSVPQTSWPSRPPPEL